MNSRRRTLAAALATILTSTGLYPIFAGGAWWWAGVGATLIVAAAGSLTRLRRLPVPVCLLGGLAGLLLYLNLVFAHGQSLGALLPTPSSLGYLGNLAGQGAREAGRYAPPVPELPGMVLLAAGGIGLTALLVDLIAVRLGSAAVAGVPLLLLFTEPFTLSVSRSWLGTTTVFCLAAAGYLTLLGTEGRERIREWEQPRAGWAADLAADRLAETGLSELRPPDTRALAAAGRRVGLASVVMALCVPLFVPGLHVTRLFGSGSPGIGGYGGSGGGAGGAGFPDPQTQISGELRTSPAQPVLSYQSNAASPGYLQVYVLGDLTAQGWRFSRGQPLVSAGAGIPAPPGLRGPATYQQDQAHVSVSKNAGQTGLVALPAPYPPVQVAAPGNVQADRATLMLIDNGVQLAGLNYRVSSLDITPSEQALATAGSPPADIRGNYLNVPPSYASLRVLAQDITATATTPYAKAVALQEWFADGNFGYSLNEPTITNAAGVSNFVNNTHAGYCQQFSYAMAVLARLVGIPSRVAYGFTQGTRQRDGSYQVTTHDAHAWPELYFQDFGWLRFEPTPGGATGQGTATSPSYTAPQTGSSAQSPATALPNPSTSTGASTGSNRANQAALNHDRQLFGDSGGGGTAGLAPRGGLNPWQLAGISAGGLIVLLAAAPVLARAVIRRRRWWRAGSVEDDGDTAPRDGALADAAWRELRDDLTDYRADYLPSESPRALARRVTEEFELLAGAAGALGRVTMAAERARYSALPASGATLRRDSATVRRAIAASLPRRKRWLARVFPASVMTPALFALGQVTDVFGRIGSGRTKTVTGRLRSRTAP
jgi:transglutaminase-like putative cysteine protease